MASTCAFVPYPLCFSNPYPGNILSYSFIILSLVTLAIMDAAPIEILSASPFIIGKYGIPFVSTFFSASITPKEENVFFR